MSDFLRIVAVWSLCVSVVAGCGNADDIRLARATGVVTYKGAPLGGANVSFIPDKGPLSMGSTTSNGEFTLTTGGRAGCPVGPVKAAVAIPVMEEVSSTSPALSPGGGDAAAFAEMSKKMADATKERQKEVKKNKPKSPIPLKYSNTKTSNLSFTIDPDSSKNKFKIELND